MRGSEERWRLIVDGAGRGDWNMAVDEALLQEGISSGIPPTLRLYWWDPHTLSLGANQDAAGSVDWEALARDGYGAVRRPTGGRSILHAQELTYSVTAPSPPGGTLAAYRWIAAGLEAGLEEAGVQVGLERSRRSGASGIGTRHPCFAAAGRYELVDGAGRKVVGSAQRRRRGWLMQHGSILLGPEHLRLPRYLAGNDGEAEAERLSRVTVDCATLLGRPVAAEDLTGPFAEGFARGMGVELQPGDLEPSERERAEELRTRRFSTESWTREGRREETGSRAGA
ncbi:MAG: biotin/lipoate A/B protein ligase family protein [bacterium]